jgi:cell division septation protein DedD
MRTLFDTEEEIESKASEITLGTASLLGIFFGLVLVCGVFFGFGYSMGRGTGWGAQAKALATLPANTPRETEETATAENPPAPVPVEPQAAVPTPAPTVKEDAPQAEAPAKPVRPVLSKPSPAQPAAAYLPPADAPPSAAGQPMVQIAAVSRREDADVLVSALRQRGYGVVVRSEPQDKLLHVQVGPFADRVQATAIKQKLLSDGYNAIIKQ